MDTILRTGETFNRGSFHRVAMDILCWNVRNILANASSGIVTRYDAERERERENMHSESFADQMAVCPSFVFGRAPHAFSLLSFLVSGVSSSEMSCCCKLTFPKGALGRFYFQWSCLWRVICSLSEEANMCVMGWEDRTLGSGLVNIGMA